MGDWDGDGKDSAGMYDATTGTFFLRNAQSSGPADLTFGFGPAGATPIVGDWNHDHVDTIGIFNAGSFFLRNTSAPGSADLAFSYGWAGAIPLTGDWDALP